MADTRLIERWLPIAELGIEAVRERTPMTPYPAPNRLHVWWARRPLVASRAAILASLLPADADRGKFLHAIGIHGDPVAAKKRIDEAKKNKVKLGANPYGYKRAFSYLPSKDDRDWISSAAGASLGDIRMLDPTAGGGSIPFEAMRLGLSSTANDLNPVAALILRATAEWPAKYGFAMVEEFRRLTTEFVRRAEPRFRGVFPEEAEDTTVVGYLWARTISCPHCDGLVPLSPNWRLATDGTGVRLKPQPDADMVTGGGRTCSFEIVNSVAKQSEGTVVRGTGKCPYPDCCRVIDGDEIKHQAQAGTMGEQLFAVAYKKRIITRRKGGKRGKDKWVRGYRAPRPADDNSLEIRARLAERMADWDALDIVPSERIPDGNKTAEPRRYGMSLWRDMFSPRQLLCHGTSVEIFREMLEFDETENNLSDLRRAAYGYVAITLDTVLNYNNRLDRWDQSTGRVRSIFDRHDFAFVWSYAEMAPLISGMGYDWALEKTTKCIHELVSLCHSGASNETADLLSHHIAENDPPEPAAVTCRPGDNLDHVLDGSIDVIVIDPPYYNNVMYAELSDFFYVWLKRTAGHLFSELFRLQLTDKDTEAVANPARVQKPPDIDGTAGPSGAKGRQGVEALAGQEYQERVARIFSECRRILRPTGIMTLMFMHKATSAWDALAKGLIEAGFVINASWPINTEATGSLHIKDKAAANSTTFLVCRVRDNEHTTAGDIYWEDVEPEVAKAVRGRVAEFQAAGIRGVDLYLAAFGPALEVLSRHWPLKRGTPRPPPQHGRRSANQPTDTLDPYATTPEDALDVARREVKRWRLEELTERKTDADLDGLTAFFVLAWDAFQAPVFAYDEALSLGRAVGVDLDREVIGRIAVKSSSNIRLLDSVSRAAKGALGPVDGSRGMIDVLHRAAHAARTRTVESAQKLLVDVGVDKERRFLDAFRAVLEILPPSRKFTGEKLEKHMASAGDDFDALYNLYRHSFTDVLKEPKQLELFEDGASS